MVLNLIKTVLFWAFISCVQKVTLKVWSYKFSLIFHKIWVFTKSYVSCIFIKKPKFLGESPENLFAILFCQIYHSKVLAVLVVVYPRGFIYQAIIPATKLLFYLFNLHLFNLFYLVFSKFTKFNIIAVIYNKGGF